MQPSPPLKTCEIEGSCDLKSLFYWESMKLLHGKYLCDVGISEGFGAAISGEAESVPSKAALVAKAWWQLPGEGTRRNKSRVKMPLCWCPSKIQAVSSYRPGNAQHEFPHPAGWLLLCSVCKPPCVAGDRSCCTVPRFPHLGREVDMHLLPFFSVVETNSFKQFEVLQ